MPTRAQHIGENTMIKNCKRKNYRKTTDIVVEIVPKGKKYKNGYIGFKSYYAISRIVPENNPVGFYGKYGGCTIQDIINFVSYRISGDNHCEAYKKTHDKLEYEYEKFGFSKYCTFEEFTTAPDKSIRNVKGTKTGFIIGIVQTAEDLPGFVTLESPCPLFDDIDVVTLSTKQLAIVFEELLNNKTPSEAYKIAME